MGLMSFPILSGYSMTLALPLLTAAIAQLSLAAGNANSTNDDLVWQKHVITNSKDDRLPFRLLLPLDYDKTKTYPLILFLHGGGAEGTDNEKQLATGVPLLATKERRKKFPCF